MQYDIDSWYRPEILASLLKDLYIKQQQAIGLDAAVAQSLADYMDDESLLLALEDTP